MNRNRTKGAPGRSWRYEEPPVGRGSGRRSPSPRRGRSPPPSPRRGRSPSPHGYGGGYRGRGGPPRGRGGRYEDGGRGRGGPDEPRMRNEHEDW
ncbi:hypothetical protein SeLEV6574_g00092 [Synchytrium endobioticum]|uniref:Uncharacterized protein n=1 Tax=Synchytrium endobioticum TaxID=286115 RepID=A0A507DJB0_9FUNG|nr:hypothetical protein SeLEV6574_g00092 [Synchytrium endobioticum]